MYQQSYSVAGERELTLNIEHGGGDLYLLGADETYLRIQGEGDADDYKSEYRNGTLTMRLHEDCVFFIPRQMNLRVSGRFGDLQISELAGDLSIAGGQGDVSINAATGTVQLDSVKGDLRASQLGSLNIADGVRGDVVIQEAAGAVQLGEVSGDLKVAEAGSLIMTADVKGSAKIAAMRGPVALQAVAGDLVARQTQNFSVGAVHGDAHISDVVGNLSVGSVSGDVYLQSVSGDVSLSGAAGDARLSDIEGSVGSLAASGDLYLQIALQPERSYEFSAGGDLSLALPADAAARFECTVGGEISNRFTGEKINVEHGAWKGEIGEGGPLVKLYAGSDIKIKPQEGGNVEFRININKEEMKRAKEEMKRAKEEVKRLRREFRHQMRSSIPDPDKLRDEIDRSVREGMRHSMRFHHHAPRPPRPPRPPRSPRGPHGRTFSFSWPGFNWEFGPKSSAESESGKSKVSDEERMAILKMLEEKRITPEQAEMLLNALGEE